MPNDVFHLPQEPQAPKAPDFQARLDADQYSPEKFPEPYRIFDDIVREVDMHRDEALQVKEPKQKWITAFPIRLSPPPKTEDSILEEESFAFTKSKFEKFWLGKKSERPQSPHYKNMADWYYARYDEPIKSWTALHFITSDTRIFKLYNGNEYEPTAEDVTNLINDASAYLDAVRRLRGVNVASQDLPVPDTADELIAQIDQAHADRVEIPNTAAEIVDDDDVYQRLLREARDKAISSKL
jgi:hypothetical protein